jgi:transposase-like protein
VNKAEQKRELWRQRIAQQESSGQSIRAYCRGGGLHEHAFYGWRQRLRKQSAPVKFALVETKPTEAETAPPIELMLASGDRLRIPHDAATLRLVLAVLREQA